ncbi:MAG: c-type cytochrome [Gallionellaceae bacterium]|jgi:cytochrome c oxidase cbb3-type subunit 3
MSDNHNSAGGVPTTGHVWDDDLGDFVNQPPKWWMLGLTASTLWVVVYWVMYPSIPFATSGNFFQGIGLPGSGQWTAIKEMEADTKDLDAVRGEYENQLKGKSAAAILADAKLSEYVIRSGKVLFADNCAACHGQNGVGTIQAGAKFKAHEQGLMAPVLNDDDWLYGGTSEKIYESISAGRQAMMMAHKEMLSEAEIDTLANAVAKGEPTSTPLFPEKGCTACHGVDGKGNADMGSANLTDKLWRFDGSLEGIKHTIKYGVNSGDPQARIAVMPNFTAAGKLSEVEMQKLAVYVYKFGGGQAAPAAAPAAEPAAVVDAASAPAAAPAPAETK